MFKQVIHEFSIAARLICNQGKIAYGQETRNSSHHVAIKLIMTDSEEHRILQFLQSQGMKVLKDNCLVPVLDVLSNGPFSFVVMPRQVHILYLSYFWSNNDTRWSACIDLPEGGPIKNVIRIVHSLLKVCPDPQSTISVTPTRAGPFLSTPE